MAKERRSLTQAIEKVAERIVQEQEGTSEAEPPKPEAKSKTESSKSKE